MANLSLECCRGRLLSRAPRIHHLSRRQTTTEHMSKVISEDSLQCERRSLSSSLVRTVTQTQHHIPASHNFSQGRMLNKIMSFSNSAKNMVQSGSIHTSRVIDTLNLEIPSRFRIIANKLYKMKSDNTTSNSHIETTQSIGSDVDGTTNNESVNILAETIPSEVPEEPKPKIPHHEIYDAANYVREQHSLEEALLKKYDGVDTYYSQIILPQNLAKASDQGNPGLNFFSLEQKLAAADQKVEELIKSSNEQKDLDTKLEKELTVTNPEDNTPPSTTQRILKAAGTTIPKPGDIISGISQRIPNLPYISLQTKKEEAVDDSKPNMKKAKTKVLAKRTVKIAQADIEKKTRELSITFTWATTQRSRFCRLEDLCRHIAEYPETRAIAMEVRTLISRYSLC